MVDELGDEGAVPAVDGLGRLPGYTLADTASAAAERIHRLLGRRKSQRIVFVSRDGAVRSLEGLENMDRVSARYTIGVYDGRIRTEQLYEDILYVLRGINGTTGFLNA